MCTTMLTTETYICDRNHEVIIEFVSYVISLVLYTRTFSITNGKLDWKITNFAVIFGSKTKLPTQVQLTLLQL